MKVYQVYLDYPRALNVIVETEEEIERILTRSRDLFENASREMYHIRSLEEINLQGAENPHRMPYDDAQVLLREYMPTNPRIDYTLRFGYAQERTHIYVLFEEKDEALALLKEGYIHLPETCWSGLARILLPLYQEGSSYAEMDAKYAGSRITPGSERTFDGWYYFSWHLKHGRLRPDDWQEYTNTFHAIYEEAWDRYFFVPD